MGAANSTYSGGSSGSFSWEPPFSLEGRRRSRWDHLGDTDFRPSPFFTPDLISRAGIPDLTTPHGVNQAISIATGVGAVSGSSFDMQPQARGSFFSSPGIMSPLSEPHFDPVPGSYCTASNVPCSPLKEPKFHSVYGSEEDQDESAFRPSPDFLQDSSLKEPPEPAANFHTVTTPSTSDNEPWKFTGTVQQDCSLLPSPMLGDMKASVVFNKNGTEIGLKVINSNVSSDILGISHTSRLPSLGLDEKQFSCQLGRIHDGSIFDPVKSYRGTASLAAENSSHSFQMSSSVTGLTDPGLLDFNIGVKSGHTGLSFASRYDVSKQTNTLGLNLGHRTSITERFGVDNIDIQVQVIPMTWNLDALDLEIIGSKSWNKDNIAQGLGVDKIAIQGKCAYNLMADNLNALDLEIIGSKSWNKDSKTSVGAQADLYNRRCAVKGKHVVRRKQALLSIEAECPLGSKSSKSVHFCIQPVLETKCQ